MNGEYVITPPDENAQLFNDAEDTAIQSTDNNDSKAKDEDVIIPLKVVILSY